MLRQRLSKGGGNPKEEGNDYFLLKALFGGTYVVHHVHHSKVLPASLKEAKNVFSLNLQAKKKKLEFTSTCTSSLKDR